MPNMANLNELFAQWYVGRECVGKVYTLPETAEYLRVVSTTRVTVSYDLADSKGEGGLNLNGDSRNGFLGEFGDKKVVEGVEVAPGQEVVVMNDRSWGKFLEILARRALGLSDAETEELDEPCLVFATQRRPP